MYRQHTIFWIMQVTGTDLDMAPPSPTRQHWTVKSLLDQNRGKATGHKNALDVPIANSANARVPPPVPGKSSARLDFRHHGERDAQRTRKPLCFGKGAFASHNLSAQIDHSGRADGSKLVNSATHCAICPQQFPVGATFAFPVEKKPDKFLAMWHYTCANA
jgi:hypothetical protein